MRAVGGERARWGDQEHLLATVADLLIQLNHNYVQSHSRSKLRPPTLIRRPGREPDRPGTTRYKGSALPLDELRRLTRRWRQGGDDHG